MPLTFDEVFQQFYPPGAAVLHSSVVPDEGALFGFGRNGTKTETWIGTYKAAVQLPFWLILVYRRQKSLHANGEEGCQNYVEDRVEHQEFAWNRIEMERRKGVGFREEE